MAVRVDTSGVSATKVRPTEERAHIPKTIYCLLVYKCLNVYTYTLSAYLPVGRSVRPSIYASITPSTLISYHLYINDFQLVLFVNTDQTAEKYVDIVTTTQTVTMVTGHVWRDVIPVIGTMNVKHVRFFYYQSLKHMCAFYDNSVKFLGDFFYKNNAETCA